MPIERTQTKQIAFAVADSAVGELASAIEAKLDEVISGWEEVVETLIAQRDDAVNEVRVLCERIKELEESKTKGD